MGRLRAVVAVVTVIVTIGVLLIVRATTDGPSRSGTGNAARPSPSPTPSRSPEPSDPSKPSPKPTPDDHERGRSPFTGLSGKPKPVLASKIDNVAPARPATGLAAADLVFVEPVEAGLSRLLAVFSSRLPDPVGPIRSARESDIELLRQFGRPAFAYSGAQSKLLPLLDRASFIDVSATRAGSAYFRSSSRVAPHNLYAHPNELLDNAKRAGRAHDIGFEFGARPSGGRPVDSYTVRYPAFRLDAHWSNGRWQLSMDGSPVRGARGARGATPGPKTIVVQYTEIRDSRFKDSGGNITPYTETVGSGRAVVLRDGRAYDTRWSRPSAKSGTSYHTKSGAPMRFDRGQVWVVFAYAR